MAASNQLLVINVLQKESYDDCHIKNSINVPMKYLKEYAQKLDKNQHIIVYCANYACTASNYAYRELTELGFKNVWEYAGGIAEWYQMGFPVEGSCSNNYLHEANEKIETTDTRTISAAELKQRISGG